jgi:pyruvate formate lyase activating enzyme
LSTADCRICRNASPLIAEALGVCPYCLRRRFPEARQQAAAAHAASRSEFNLPLEPPRHPGGVQCRLCSNECSLGEGERGFCGLSTVRQGRLVHLAGTAQRGLLHWYRDPLPTNCVADWVCQGTHHPGYHNLAVFYASCTSNCLYCQNWHFRQASPAESSTISAQERHPRLTRAPSACAILEATRPRRCPTPWQHPGFWRRRGCAYAGRPTA